MSRRVFAMAAAALCTTLTAQAASDAAVPQSLEAVSGKTVCRAAGAVDGKASELCVTLGTFAHDLYEVRFDGVPAVKGIDDATTEGIAGTYSGRTIALKCDPILSAPDTVTDAQIDAVRFMDPSGSRDALRQMAIRMNTVETGRHCVARADAAPLFAIDVRFP